MKPNIHPQLNTNVQVKCSCGNSFVTASTIKAINVEVCSACHPFYTGKQKVMKTGQVDKFKKRMEKTTQAKTKTTKNKKEKRKEKDAQKPENKTKTDEK